MESEKNNQKPQESASQVERFVMPPPRTFDHFPETDICPVCKTSNDGVTVLIPIDGTGEDNICQAAPLHLKCAVAKHYDKEHGLFYIRVEA